MKTKDTLLFLNMILASFFLNGQDLSNFELRGHYQLNSDGGDKTGINDSIYLDNPVFSDGGILSIGCYVLNSNFGDSCLIETPSINALNENSFAVQVDFKITRLGRPIFIMGHRRRYLGLETWSGGNPYIRMNNTNKITLDDIKMEKDQWYNATFIHTKGDSITQLYIDGNLVHTEKEYLRLEDDDTDISNTNFAVGRAFGGYLKDLKIYSSEMLISTVKNKSRTKKLVFWPNPVREVLNFDNKILEFDSYRILDVLGKELINSKIESNSINVQGLKSGVYLLILFDDGKNKNIIKFIKE